jgi:transcriptional regulator with PAS, ATPase and Fis domain
MAHHGTIFLDEIAEMIPAIQVKFLRILQDGTVRRVGGTGEMKVDARVVAATNKDPLKAIQDGSLREDLYYRLQVCTITLPPLRDRNDDIPLLIEAFINEFNEKYDRRVRSVDDAALRTLLGYSWPGNVRELRNVVERAIITCESELIAPKHLPLIPASERSVESSTAISVSVGTTVEEAEKLLILKTLASTNNNKTRAAEILGISLKTLHNKLHRYGVQDAPKC